VCVPVCVRLRLSAEAVSPSYVYRYIRVYICVFAANENEHIPYLRSRQFNKTAVAAAARVYLSDRYRRRYGTLADKYL